jgi:hypothetical protein
MFRFWKTTSREASSHTSRRGRRRFVPSLSGTASCLEERVVPAGGQAANLAALAQALADTGAGHVVTNMFQSILMTNPTAAQLVRDVRRLRGGLGVNALRNSLFSSAQRQQLLSSLNVNVNTRPQALVNSLFTNVLNQTPTASATAPFVNAINGGMNRQLVVQAFLSNAIATGRSLTFAAGLGQSSTTTGTTVGTTSTSTTGTTSTISPLQSLLMSGSVTTPTSGVSITPISQLGFSQLALSQLAFSPVTVANSPVNASPVSTIPVGNPLVVNSPVNASPIASPIPGGNNLTSIFSVV